VNRKPTRAADDLVDEVRSRSEAIEDEAYDLAIDAVGDCDRFDVGEETMVTSAYGEYVRIEDAQDAIRKLQR
jgi:hypothetical protein